MRETTNYGLKITEGNDNWKNIFDDNADNMDTIDEALAAKLETVPDMGGATALTPGTAGLAPAPSAGETNRFLRADGTWTVPAGSGDSEVGIYTIDATIPVSSWQGSGPYTVTISNSSIISTMQVLEWSIVNETEATPLMLGPTEPTISAGRLTISTTVKPVASWTVHFDLGTDGSNVLAEVAGKAGQELLGYKEEGNTASRTIASGKFVVWKGNLYKAKVAIPQGTAFSTSNLTAVGDGGFNELQTKIGAVGNTDLQSQVTSLNSNIGAFHNVNMTKNSNDENDKPWLVIKRLFSSLPVGIMVGTIACAGYRNYFGFKSNDNYGVFYVDMYSYQVPPYRVIVINGVVRYGAFTIGTYETA